MTFHDPFKPAFLVFAFALVACATLDAAASTAGGPQHQCPGGVVERLHSLEPTPRAEAFGRSLAVIGDVDGDGVADIAVGAPDTTPAALLGQTGAVFIHSGATGRVLIGIPGRDLGERFGYSVAAVGDVNQNGVPDVLVGAPYYSSGLFMSRIGSMRIHDAGTGAQLLRIDGQVQYEKLGHAVASVEDADGDGIRDAFVGIPGAARDGGHGVGAAIVYSSVTGAELLRLDARGMTYGLGSSLTGVGDVNGDGTEDLLVGAPFSEVRGMGGAGSAFLVSGATGSVLHRHDGQFANDWLGWSLTAMGDVGGDGVPDYAIGVVTAPWAARGGSVRLVNGATKAVTRRLELDGVFGEFGTSIDCAGDVDGDGVQDLVVGAPQKEVRGFVRAGAAYVFSGATGADLGRINGRRDYHEFGFEVAGLGDVDGDGRSEVAVGFYNEAGTKPGGAHFFSVSPLLRSDRHKMSVAAGGRVRFGLEFPPSEAGRRYALRGSASGSGPRLHDEMCIPLTPDWLTRRMAAGNAPWFTGIDGNLDAQGRATAVLEVPPNSPAMARLAGTTLWFAAYTAGPFTGIRESSVAVPLDVVP